MTPPVPFVCHTGAAEQEADSCPRRWGGNRNVAFPIFFLCECVSVMVGYINNKTPSRYLQIFSFQTDSVEHFQNICGGLTDWRSKCESLLPPCGLFMERERHLGCSHTRKCTMD